MSSLLKHIIKDIAASKIRSILTVLGIVVGIASVTAMVSVGESAEKMIRDSLSNSVGENTLLVTPGQLEEGNTLLSPSMLLGSLTDNDYRYLSSVAEEKNNIQVSRRALSEATLTYNGQDFEVSLFIVDPEYSYITGADIYKGAPFNRDSVKENSESVLINSTLEKQIFKIQEPINKELDIDGKSFAVRGVSRSPFQSLGSDLKVVYITQDSYRTHFSNSLRVSSIFVGTYDSSKVEQLKRELEVGLRQNRGLTTAEKSDFTIQTQEDLLKTTSQITDTITLFITVISSISLFVGGIGIMNIMLVSVKERVKEVGLRKAVGATNQDILVQFLTESVLFSIVGALIGTMLGNLIALTIQHIAHLPRYVSQGAVINSIIVATAVGLLFGLYPALNAAKLSPIEALRGE